MKKGKKEKVEMQPSSESVMGQPVTVWDIVNKYGTYEIQPTSDSENEYPTIAQGYPGKPPTPRIKRDK